VIGLSAGLATVGIFALVVAFSSSTQDIVVDVADRGGSDSDELGLLSSAYQLGYRAAIIVTARSS
jgi:PAT family beta-lactamase induction signal transducer AmpG